MPFAEGIIFQNENFSYGIMSKIWLWSYTALYSTQLPILSMYVGQCQKGLAQLIVTGIQQLMNNEIKAYR